MRNRVCHWLVKCVVAFEVSFDIWNCGLGQIILFWLGVVAGGSVDDVGIKILSYWDAVHLSIKKSRQVGYIGLKGTIQTDKHFCESDMSVMPSVKTENI